ncbi:IS481 family transposase, partial [Arhodomonas aquaeolei]|uniref:IS481 family transposase n=1 Tax=Arhodomonas aquaeolei TaxID=2369 RepID=UPI0012EB0F09
MDTHHNAALTPRGRARMVRCVTELGWSYRAAAQAFHVAPRTVHRWVARYRREGCGGLYERSSRPRRQPRRTPRGVSRQIIARRHQRWTMERIAAEAACSRATVSRVLRQAGLNRLAALQPREPPRRYQHEHPGDLLHLDIKKLGRFQRPGHRATGKRTHESRGAGWEFVHVAVDDRSRIAHTAIEPDETADSAIRHLRTALAYYARLGVTVRRVLTDNGACYRSRAFARACRELGLQHRFTRPYRPR